MCVIELQNQLKHLLIYRSIHFLQIIINADHGQLYHYQVSHTYRTLKIMHVLVHTIIELNKCKGWARMSKNKANNFSSIELSKLHFKSKKQHHFVWNLESAKLDELSLLRLALSLSPSLSLSFSIYMENRNETCAYKGYRLSLEGEVKYTPRQFDAPEYWPGTVVREGHREMNIER